ncbi:MAG: hypothetical protein ACREQY_12005 [Candidatus Binatia bacterium]
MTGRGAVRAIVPVVLLGFGALALAQEHVALRVRTVLATDTGSEFDARLDQHRQQLKGLFRYSSYRLVKEEERRCPWGSPNSFEIPGGRYLQVLPIGYKNERVKLKVILIESGNAPLDTDFSLPNHGNIWVGGPKHPDGVLLISIGAEADK